MSTLTTPPARAVLATGVDFNTDADRINASMRLTVTSEHAPQLRRAAADARLDYVAAVMAMDAAESIPGRHNLQEQADVETALRALGQALADYARGEAAEITPCAHAESSVE
ncbi:MULTISPECIES: hypothetical protein [unclassified Microbacterium]|uniref:hypothetical protein n=1 Tax=unclassified Microbacterium TaxID=2609290 RepID=UPI002883497C|nr:MULTISPECIES: hypothetical protein [unclassified Microbacterium]